ncbi:hypothetical protein WA026_004247 [Henosepilachna vigintioctopunctata]|uniref:Uncharacterized protein n=1 Tax=Henosepilachna vigintioctopunctata TaxID=420089 RepID=A0AAW1V9I4_9CUCU
MKYLGFDVTALKWFNGYLSNRKQVVEVDESVSELSHVEYGVHQGSNLGHCFLQFTLLIFLVFSGVAPIIFMLMTCKSICLANPQLQQTTKLSPELKLENLTQWCAKNALKLNLDKSKALLIRGGAHARTIDMENLSGYELGVKRYRGLPKLRISVCGSIMSSASGNIHQN